MNAPGWRLPWITCGLLASTVGGWLLWLSAEPVPSVEDVELATSAAEGQRAAAALGCAALLLGATLLLVARCLTERLDSRRFVDGAPEATNS